MMSQSRTQGPDLAPAAENYLLPDGASPNERELDALFDEIDCDSAAAVRSLPGTPSSASRAAAAGGLAPQPPAAGSKCRESPRAGVWTGAPNIFYV